MMKVWRQMSGSMLSYKIALIFIQCCQTNLIVTLWMHLNVQSIFGDKTLMDNKTLLRKKTLRMLFWG